MRYIKHPLHEKELPSSVIFLRNITPLLIDLSRTMEYQANLIQEYANDHYYKLVLTDWQKECLLTIELGDELIGTQILKLRHIAVGYYEVWMLRHILRVMIILHFGYDVWGSYVHTTKH